MPNLLAFGFHESNQGEYLAQYFLSAFGVSAPVLRQEDIGVDFFCSLAKTDKKRLTFHSPYMVQHGAGTKEFVYGGYNKRTKKWRGEGIQWLFSQELPLFLCVTDRRTARMRLYSTSALWLIRYKFGNMTQIELCPDENHDPLKDSKGEKIGKKGHGDGYTYRVPLGRPIVDLTIQQLNNEKPLIEKVVEALRIAIEVEQKNLTLRRLGVHVVSWFPATIPNDPASLKITETPLWNTKPGQNVDKQLKSLKDIAMTLALNFLAQKDHTRLSHLASVFRLFSKNDFPKRILEKLPPFLFP